MVIETAMILAGGLGTRFKEYTKDIPKPMINANGIPLLVHIINFYTTFDVKKIYVLAGYKKEIIYVSTLFLIIFQYNVYPPFLPIEISHFEGL